MQKTPKSFFISVFILIFISLIWVTSTGLFQIAKKSYAQEEFGINDEGLGIGTNNDPGEYLRVIVSPDQQSLLKGKTAQFTVVVLNTSTNVDLIDVNVNAPLVPDCNKSIGNLAANSNFAPYSCSLLNVQNGFTNEVSVQGSNPLNGRIDAASAAAVVDLLDLKTNILPVPAAIPEPGGDISFTVAISNTGSIDFELTELTSLQFGDLTDSTNPAVLSTNCMINIQPLIITAGGKEFVCSFLGKVSGQPSEVQINITATGDQDSKGNILEKTSQSIVQIIDVPATLTVSLTPSLSSVFAPSGMVEFTAKIENTSLVDSISITKLNDSVFGDVTNKGSCFLPKQIQPGEIFSCTYTQEVTGEDGDIKTFALTAEGLDDDIPAGTVSNVGQTVIEIHAPPIYSVLFPWVIDFIDEPNNTCLQVFPISTNHVYYFQANDVFDLYEFSLQESNQVSISLNNFLPKKGQLIAYKDIGEGCANSEVLMNDADESTEKKLNLGEISPGRYFVLVLNEGVKDIQEPYRLEVVAGELAN